MIILDYPNRISEKEVTEEGRRILKESMAKFNQFMEQYDVKYKREHPGCSLIITKKK